MCVDTTFQTNKPEMPFAPIMETFLTTMPGKHPSTIFTDQDAAMEGAIAYVFPNTSHCLCLRHIYLNAAKHLSHVIHDSDNKFQPDFKRYVYEDRSENYFITTTTTTTT